jgi:hypothetical protein
MMLLLILGLATTARAADPVFAQDPLCAESVSQFRESFDKARPIHLKFPQFRAVVDAQNRWFAAVTREMKKICEDDAKFASELAKKDRSALNGQCKPAAEAALADQEVLDHSEASLKHLQLKREEFRAKPGTDHESLAEIFERDHKRVDVDALDLWDVPRAAGCELRWLYPQELLRRKVPFTGCPEAPPGVKLSEGDKKDAGVFAQLLTRFLLSLDYNTQRRNKAAAAAKASRGRYEACIAQQPGAENVLMKASQAGGREKKNIKGTGHAAPGSDITGIEQDQEKRKK